jgi:FtsP/CotA-like multicopper oxidase with cupredoxin domain
MFFLGAIPIASAVLSLIASASAGSLPQDHILYGRKGLPSTLVKRFPEPTPVPEPATVADGACKNGAFTRQCWSSGYSVADDFDLKWPNTGVTRKYNFAITNTTCAPDGIKRNCMLINGQYPGPTIFANWGDMIQVTLTNKLQNNGTGLHWHGIRQLNTNSQDGAPGLTECPLAPGDSKTYKFQATQVCGSFEIDQS